MEPNKKQYYDNILRVAGLGDGELTTLDSKACVSLNNLKESGNHPYIDENGVLRVAPSKYMGSIAKYLDRSGVLDRINQEYSEEDIRVSSVNIQDATLSAVATVKEL